MECVIAGHTMDAWSTINKILQADVSRKDSETSTCSSHSLYNYATVFPIFMVSIFAGSCIDTTEEYSNGEIMN